MSVILFRTNKQTQVEAYSLVADNVPIHSTSNLYFSWDDWTKGYGLLLPETLDSDVTSFCLFARSSTVST
jgi:hypothetical protein